MAKVLCESCGTLFPYKAIKDSQNCPVCGKPLWEDEEENSETADAVEAEEDGLMYFDAITEYNGVEAYCSECGELAWPKLDLFDELVDGKYVKLKEDVVLKCDGCGKEHKPRKILYKRKESYTSLLPRCPLCNSYMLKRITLGSKILAAATMGSFALPYNSKTFECQNCHFKF